MDLVFSAAFFQEQGFTKITGSEDDNNQPKNSEICSCFFIYPQIPKTTSLKQFYLARDMKDMFTSTSKANMGER